MSTSNLQTFVPGPREEQILPALVHRSGHGFERCLTPSNCEECAPKVNARRAFYQAQGEQRERLDAQLAEARALDDAEAREHALIRLQHSPS